jgi:Tol biopolymer transport system component
MNPNGSSQTRLTNNPAADYTPDWSPDGSKIAFVSNRDGDHESYVMNANGSSPIRLTTTAGLDVQPVWSPDGEKILFTSRRDGPNVSTSNEVYVMNANGSGQTRLTSNSVEDNDAVWQSLPRPAQQEQCRKDGWRRYVDADGQRIFKNQGDCVSFVATGGKNPPSGP